MASNGVAGVQRVRQVDDRFFALADDADIHFRRGVEGELGGGGNVFAARHDRALPESGGATN